MQAELNRIGCWPTDLFPYDPGLKSAIQTRAGPRPGDDE